jgi:hypothetical protein
MNWSLVIDRIKAVKTRADAQEFTRLFCPGYRMIMYR